MAENNAFVKDDTLYGKTIETVPKEPKNIGIDVDASLIYDLANLDASQRDLSEIEKFTNISTDRNTLYSLIDQMAADPRMSVALEYYAEDSTERNEQGKIVWAESNDADTAKYINFLLDSLNINKNIYGWVYSLCKYGDVYVRLYRESEMDDDLFQQDEDETQEKKQLNESAQMQEDLNVKAYSKNDRYVHYVEMVPNPAEMFELTRFGQSRAFIQAPAPFSTDYNYTSEEAWLANAANRYTYKFKKEDITIYPPTEFVHALIDDNVDRFPETVDIFKTNDDYESDKNSLSYSVRKGHSLLAGLFKVWREMMLLENSVLLNRITKSSIVRVIGVEIGDMPKEMVKPHLNGVKSLIEQKTAIHTNDKMSEYTNPGPIENNIYIPTRNGQGAITTTQIGGDVDVKSLIDLDHFADLLYGQLGIPKQYMGVTDDSTGFNGGTSLSLISAKYAKRVKKIQQAMINMITDLINLLLVQKKQTKYINKFSIQMLKPMTEEEKNRQENLSSEIQMVSDVMNLTQDIEDPIIKLKMLKALLSNSITNTEVIDLIQEQIDALEAQIEEGNNPDDEEKSSDEDMDLNFDNDYHVSGGNNFNDDASDFASEFGGEEETGGEETATEEPASTGGETVQLPSMNDIGLDFADSTQF